MGLRETLDKVFASKPFSITDYKGLFRIQCSDKSVIYTGKKGSAIVDEVFKKEFDKQNK